MFNFIRTSLQSQTDNLLLYLTGTWQQPGRALINRVEYCKRRAPAPASRESRPPPTRTRMY